MQTTKLTICQRLSSHSGVVLRLVLLSYPLQEDTPVPHVESKLSEVWVT
jgi:hypothetical protein